MAAAPSAAAVAPPPPPTQAHDRISDGGSTAGCALRQRDPASPCVLQHLRDTLQQHPHPHPHVDLHPCPHPQLLQLPQAGSSNVPASRESSFGSCGSFALSVAGDHNASCRLCSNLAAAAAAAAAAAGKAVAYAESGGGTGQLLQQTQLPGSSAGTTGVDGGRSAQGSSARGVKVPTVNLQQVRAHVGARALPDSQMSHCNCAYAPARKQGMVMRSCRRRLTPVLRHLCTAHALSAGPGAQVCHG